MNRRINANPQALNAIADSIRDIGLELVRSVENRKKLARAGLLGPWLNLLNERDSIA